MVNKHFFKILTIFASIIMLGLIGLFAIEYFEHSDGVQATNSNNQAEIAK